jgi:HEAT repeat protein
MKPICQISHSQILAGSCPWCDCQVGDHELLRESAERIWNVAAMAAALDDCNDEVRSMTVANLMHNGPPMDQAIPLLSKALDDCSDEIRRQAEQALSSAGRKMAAQDARRIEAQIAGSPHELGFEFSHLAITFSDNVSPTRHAAPDTNTSCT